MSVLTLQKDRAVRQWVVQNGSQRAAFEPEDEVKALQFTVRLNNPKAAELVERLLTKFPQLGGLDIRAWRGAYLVTIGHVHFHEKQPVTHTIGTVICQNASDRYIIQEREVRVCNCPDYQFCKAPETPRGQRLCKHVIAYSIALELVDRQPVYEPLPTTTQLAGTHAGETVVRKGVPVAPDGLDSTYINGQPVQPEHKQAFDSFVAANRIAPYSQERCMSWYYGQ